MIRQDCMNREASHVKRRARRAARPGVSRPSTVLGTSRASSPGLVESSAVGVDLAGPFRIVSVMAYARERVAEHVLQVRIEGTLYKTVEIALGKMLLTASVETAFGVFGFLAPKSRQEILRRFGDSAYWLMNGAGEYRRSLPLWEDLRAQSQREGRIGAAPERSHHHRLLLLLRAEGGHPDFVVA